MAVGIGTILLVSALAGLIGDYVMHQENKQYNSAEAEKSREFNAQEAEKSRDFSAEEAEISRTFNSSEAQKERQWQKMMSDTAHQREIADLKAAGLNPILSANSGAAVSSGASASSTPAVSTFGGSSAQAVSKPYRVSNSINSAIGNAVKFTMEMQPQDTYQRIYRNGKLVRVVSTEKIRG